MAPWIDLADSSDLETREAGRAPSVDDPGPDPRTPARGVWEVHLAAACSARPYRQRLIPSRKSGPEGASNSHRRTDRREIRKTWLREAWRTDSGDRLRDRCPVSSSRMGMGRPTSGGRDCRHGAVWLGWRDRYPASPLEVRRPVIRLTAIPGSSWLPAPREPLPAPRDAWPGFLDLSASSLWV